jgi:hypothetical protein
MHMADWFNVGASTIIRYVDIICDVLINKNELFNKDINIPFNECLNGINACFENLIVYPTYVEL